MAVPVSNAQRLTCAAKRSGVSPTVLRAALVREGYNPALRRPIWNALTQAAGLGQHPDGHTRAMVLDALLEQSAAELTNAEPAIVASVLTRKRDLLEGVGQ